MSISGVCWLESERSTEDMNLALGQCWASIGGRARIRLSVNVLYLFSQSVISRSDCPRVIFHPPDYHIRFAKLFRTINYVELLCSEGGDPRVVVSTATLHARVLGSFPGLGGLKETKMFLPHPLVKLSIVGSLRDREVARSASDLQGFKPVSGG